MAMIDVRIHRDADISPPEIEAIVKLVTSVWPSKDKTLAERLRQFTSWVEENRQAGLEVASFVAWDGNRAIAHARTFPRNIYTQSGAITVMGLAGVCVLPERRGEGLGKAVVLRAFGRVDSGAFAVSLFQTGVPDFYRRLGAGLVANQFVNRLEGVNP